MSARGAALFREGVAGPSGRARHRPDGPDLDGAVTRVRDARGDADRFVEVLGLDEVVPAELLLGLGEGPVGRDGLAVPHANRGRGSRRLEGVPGPEVAGL